MRSSREGLLELELDEHCAEELGDGRGEHLGVRRRSLVVAELRRGSVGLGRLDVRGPGRRFGAEGRVAGERGGDLGLAEGEDVRGVVQHAPLDEPASSFQQRPADEPARPHEGEGDVVVAHAVAGPRVGEQIVEAGMLRRRYPVAHRPGMPRAAADPHRRQP